MFLSLRSVLVGVGVLNGLFAGGQLEQAHPFGGGQDKARYTVGGAVVNAITGEPIRRALVRLNGPASASGFTDESGRFQFDNIPGGSALIVAAKPGFLGEADTPSSFVHHTSSLSVGPDSKDIQIKLTPVARIEGHVTNSEGEPVEGVPVQILQERVVDGRKQLTVTELANSNGAGHYVMDGLMPGVYYVRTQQHAVFGNPEVAQTGVEQAYPSRFYPDGSDFGSAQPQTLRGGDDAQLDFTLSPKQTFRISGVITGTMGYFGAIFEGPGQPTDLPVRFDRQTQRFVLDMVLPGLWAIDFFSRDAQGQEFYDREEINVASSNIEGMKVALQPESPIPVIVQSSSLNGQTSGSQIELFSDNREVENRSYSAAQQKGDPPGTMHIENVRPGTYRLSVRTFGSECIESAVSGSVDLLHDSLVVDGGSQAAPINVSLRNDCAGLSGTVRSSGVPAAGTILLIPDSSLQSAMVVGAQSDGAFSMSMVAPGSYHVYAFSDVTNLEYENPNALRDYSGQQISLEPNQQATVNLDLVTRKE